MKIATALQATGSKWPQVNATDQKPQFSVVYFLHFLLPPPVPCPPQNVVSVLDCSTNMAHVQWQASSGAEYYIVQAFGEEEHATGCETNSQSCNVTDLICGFTYNISVIAVNSVCNVSESDIKQLKAGKDKYCDIYFTDELILNQQQYQRLFSCCMNETY